MTDHTSASRRLMPYSEHMRRYGNLAGEHAAVQAARILAEIRERKLRNWQWLTVAAFFVGAMAGYLVR